MKYQFTPESLKELLTLLYNAALNHPDNKCSINFPVASIYPDGGFSIVHNDDLFEANHTELNLSS